MNERIEAFSGRCKKLPARLREYNAYRTLKGQIEDFQVVLPILQEFTKVHMWYSVMQWHAFIFFVMLWCAMRCITAYGLLCCPALYCTALYCTVLFFSILILSPPPTHTHTRACVGKYSWPPLAGSDGDNEFLLRLLRSWVPTTVTIGH